eukprot:TRINITY_DN95675_c0_g1_i1.p1 TRINITY_DN95675_c0_g1~~TRINITY_DN95675_c0_g1_i1.p1  ORF type:complete len:232 (-),score=54.46 TRINITY_DN95675_c0_g1_i1:103-798(-)
MNSFGGEVLKFDKSRVFSMDVECVAVGRSHESTDRAPCMVALVNGYGEELYKSVIQPERKVVSYLTPLTGMTSQDFKDAVPLSAAVKAIKEILKDKCAVLVGQKPQGDIEWMQLEAGRDFQMLLDIAEIFKGYNSRYGSWNYHALQHEAEILLGETPNATEHDPSWDAKVSVKLYYKAATATPSELVSMRQQLLNNRAKPSIAKRYDYCMDGVCMAKFMPKKCRCGRPCAK